MKPFQVVPLCIYIPDAVPPPEYDEADSGSRKSNKKVFHEEMVLQWIVAHPSHTRPLVLKNAWFFFEILVSPHTPAYAHLTHTPTHTDQEYGQLPEPQ